MLTPMKLTDSQLIKLSEERILILIPCCLRKERNGEKSYNSNRAVANFLGPFGESLMNLRRKLATYLGLQQGLDLGFEASTSISFLPAFRRYSGNLYSRISRETWLKLQDCEKVDLLIVSALYGLLTWQEHIRYYNCKMSDSLPNGQSLRNWWKGMGLGEMVAYYVRNNGIRVVHDFLSNTYRISIDEAGKRIKEYAEYIAHNYAGLGSGSNFHRGQDVNKLIQKGCK